MRFRSPLYANKVILTSRIAFALMLYNAERILRMKHPGPWAEERKCLTHAHHAKR